MSKHPENPWASHARDLADKIRNNIDHEAIEAAANVIRHGEAAGKRKLKGIYFDGDIARMLDDMKARRINVSGFVNDAVRKALTDKR